MGNDDRLVRSICAFLRLVISYEEDSKMGLHNVARIFSILFFGAPITNDPLMFVKETERRTDLLEFLLGSYTENQDMFENQSATIEYLVAKSTLKQRPVCILRGETVTYFYSTEEYAYLQTSVHVIQVNLDTLQSSFKSEKASFLKRSRGRAKRKINSEPIPMGEGRRRLSSISMLKDATTPLTRRKSTVHDLLAFIRKGS